MPSSLEAYNQLLLKVNRNDSNSNIHVPRGKFVTVFNEQARLWLKEKLEQYKGTDNLNELNDLLQDDVPLEKAKTHRDHVDFTLPEDFYAFASSYSLATKEDCKNRVLVNWDTKGKNLRVLLTDAHSAPSFEYEETLVSLSKGKMKVYFTDFHIDEVYLSYYSLPAPIDLEGYTKLDGSRSTTINPELAADAVDEIINRCAAEIMRNNQNAEGFGFAKDRLQGEK